MSGALERNPDLVWRDEPERKDEIIAALDRGEEDVGEDGWVIIVDGGVIHQMNLLAGEIWLLCDGTRDEEIISRVIADQFDAPWEVVKADVDEFVNACLEKGWLIRSEQ